MGGHLSPQNKLVFNQWWRDTFTKPGLAMPDSGLIWNYYPDQENLGFLPCVCANTPHLSSHKCGTSSPPFVSTSRALAVAHLVHRLISHGYPVLLVGDPGNGKTSLLRQVLSERNNNDMSLQHFYASQVRILVASIADSPAK